MATDDEDAAAASKIPLVDFAGWSSAPPGTPQEERRRRRRAVAGELAGACRRVGFAYVTNHGVPPEAVEAAFGWSRRFFALPAEDKRLASRPAPDVYRGYSWPGLEKVSQTIYAAEGEEDKMAESRKVQDVKESFDIGPDGYAPQPMVWPPEDALPALSGFRPFMAGFFARCHAAAAELLRALALGLGLDDEDHFVRLHLPRGDNCQLRLLHYPPVEVARLAAGGAGDSGGGDRGDHGDRVARMDAHSDWGSVTILFQDDCGGLQVEDPARPGRFVDAGPVEGALIMNVGDLLMRWTNDHLKSTLHRVAVPPPRGCEPADDGTLMTRPRYSIPFFATPAPDAVVECLPAYVSSAGDDERPARYAPVTQAEYLRMRVRGQYQ